MNTMEKTKTLTALDRCDRCNSQAWVLVKGMNGELLFCGHHYTSNESALFQWAYDIIDEREFIDK